MKTYKILLAVLVAVLLTVKCTDYDDFRTDYPELNFIWRGLNLFYLYQDQVPNLNDLKARDQKGLDAFLHSFSSAEQLFENLLYDRKTTDKYSIILSDYGKLEQILTGNSGTNGLKLGFVLKNGTNNQLFAYIKYVMPNTSASAQNITRGAIIYAINDQPLTLTNYSTLLAESTQKLSFANYDNGNITPNGQTMTVTTTPYSENPVYLAKVYTVQNQKIGYLMYNGFYTDYESNLNQAFTYFKSQAISHLVLDLRYNPGGSVATATRLASMITGQYNQQLFTQQLWNAKVMAAIDNNKLKNNFTTTLYNGSTISSLQLNKLYVLTTKSTASASELIINGLKPYIQVVQIGKTTVGKNVGSITLYDSPNYQKQNLNPNHRYAMQPIVFKSINKLGFGDYQLGISPDASNDMYEDLNNLGTLGDPTEPYFAKAISQITNNPRLFKQQPVTPYQSILPPVESLQQQMYLQQYPNAVINLLQN